MSIPAFLIRFNPARAAVDDRGMFTKEVADALTRLFEAYNASVTTTNTMVDGLEAAAFASVASRGSAPSATVIAQPAPARPGPNIILQR